MSIQEMSYFFVVVACRDKTIYGHQRRKKISCSADLITKKKRATMKLIRPEANVDCMSFSDIEHLL